MKPLNLHFNPEVKNLLTSEVFAKSPDWDAHEFRRSLSANLASGVFRVVVAVDEITDELRRTIQYLNRHTTDELEVVAVELGYVKDRDVEMIVPRVFGEEAVARKREARKPSWDEPEFWTHAEQLSSTDAIRVVRKLHEWAVDHTARFYWGEGKHHPSMTAWLDVGSEESPVWTCYLSERGPLLGLNFEWLARRLDQEILEGLAQRLREIPAARSLLRELESRDYRVRPSLPPEEAVKADSGVDRKLISAYDSLLDAPSTSPAN